MDGSRFDVLSRSLAISLSCHGVRRLLGGLMLAGPLSVFGPAAMEAKKRKKKRKKKAPPGCTPQCAGKVCGDDGCGVACGACGAVPCVSGACNCAEQPDLTDCGPGKKCSGGVCATPPTCSFNVCTVDDDCCSGLCFGGGACGTTATGDPCLVDDTCALGGNCVGFVCQG